MKNGWRTPGETATDVIIHWAAIGSVSTVTTIAAVISYGHARSLVLRYGVTGLAAYALPLTIDGLVATCSLILVDCARHDRRGPWHAWAMLALGACAQIAANVSAGLSHGIVGAIIAGWPALVACGCFELLLRHRRHNPARPAARPVVQPTPADREDDPAVSHARALYKDELAGGRVPAIRAIKRDLHVGTTRATTIQSALAGQRSQPPQQHPAAA
ncbi:MAG TPA: DUF2637 domain-containing protein [Streptosporangiaceae bacterium]|jgi:hypothetical protein